MPNQIWCFRNGWTPVCSVLHGEKHPLVGAHTHAHTHRWSSAFWGCSQNQGACQVWLQASSGCVVCAGEAQGCSSQLLLALCLLIVFPLCILKLEPQVNPSQILQMFAPVGPDTEKFLPLASVYLHTWVITRWCSPLYSFPHVEAKILVHFSFFSNISSIF